MKRFRMKKEKVVKPDGRWMYLYTFEEVGEQQPSSEAKKLDAQGQTDMGHPHHGG